MKVRLDQHLVDKGFFSSREKAKSQILAGNVLVDNAVISKAGQLIKDDAEIRLKATEKYVSRGGYKLEKALKEFDIDVNNRTVIDVGASTGGFTDCLLQNGAALVYAVDVGYNQLDFRLRQNPNVISLEKVNARNIKPELFNEAVHFAVIDVSFISLTKILKPVLDILENKSIIALIKPQFEVGESISGFKGIVRDPNKWKESIEKIIAFSKEMDLKVLNLSFSPIKGPKGNVEFLIHLSDIGEGKILDIDKLFIEAKASLN